MAPAAVRTRNELEPLLAFFASFVLETRLVQQIMRWDMAVLRESPWYQEILEEGLERGLQQGLEQGLEQGLQQGLEQGLQEGLRQGAQRQLLRVLEHRFGPVPSEVQERLRRLHLAELEALIDVALDVNSLEGFIRYVPAEEEDAREPGDDQERKEPPTPTSP